MLILKKIWVVVIILYLSLLPQAIAENTPPPVIKPPAIPAILQKISICESQNRQFNKDGTLYRGELNHHDIGYYQINEYWNGAQAKKLGFNIYTLEGNTQMALYLYHTQGTTPWNWSKSCWSKK